MENTLRRNNLHIFGIPEKSEGNNPVDFIEQWLIATFGKDNFTPFFSVEKAPPAGGNNRPFLLKLLHYKDQAILRLARQKRDLEI